jgi:hypothetical protein
VTDVNPYGMQAHVYDKTQPENIAYLRRIRALLDEFGTTFLSMISRILQLLLIDILSVGIAVDAHHLREPGEQGAANGELEQRRLLILHVDSRADR